MKRAGIQDHEPRDSLRMPHRPRHSDHPAPIMNHERDVAANVQAVHQVREVVDAAFQTEVVTIRARFVGQSAADVVGHDAAIRIAECQHEIAIVEGPSRVAMQHDDRLALTLIQIMIAQAAAIDEMTGKGIQRAVKIHRAAYQWRPSMRQFNPLPIPMKPTRSPGSRNSRSSARAAVSGSDTVPMLPRYSNVEKSFSGEMPSVRNTVSRCTEPT